MGFPTRGPAGGSGVLSREDLYGNAIAGFTIARAIRLLDLIIHSLDPSLFTQLILIQSLEGFLSHSLSVRLILAPTKSSEAKT